LFSSITKFFLKVNDNRDMKKFNLKIFAPLLLTLLFQGCVPDSLTKFKKDAPKQVSSSATSTPVVDSSGTPVVFIPPTRFTMGPVDNTVINLNLNNTVASVSPVIDGTLGDPSSSAFQIGCALDTTSNAQTQVLPSGLILSSNCTITGKATSLKSITTAFCSDSTYTDQTSCESAPLVWNSVTSTCSNKDFSYNTQANCEAAYNIWYPVGGQIPYRVRYTYKNSSATIFNIYATVNIGAYSSVPNLTYSQADKLYIVANSGPATPTALTDVVPQRTSTATVGAYPTASLLTSALGIQGVANFVDTSSTTIGFKKFIKMTLSNATVFSAGGFISTAGNVKIGKIYKKDTSNTNILYVENISNGEIFFAVGDQIDSAFPFVGMKTTITAIDDTQILDLAVNPNLDNDSQFYAPKLISSTGKTVNVYLSNSPTNIKSLKPITTIPANNGIIFSVSPKLPDGLTLDPLTGIISGKFLKIVPPTGYTISATNPLGSVSTTVRLAATDAPADLSISTKQIITVSTTAFFRDGETLFQAITPPLTEAPKGKILKILNGYQMAIDTSSGPFLAGASLDSGSGFFSEKAFVVPNDSCVNTNYTTQVDCEAATYTWSTGTVYYNLALKLDSSTPFYTIGSCSDITYTTQATCEAALKVWGPTYVTTVAGAKGVLAGIFKAANDILFVRHVTQNATGLATAKTFKQNDVLFGSGSTVIEVDYNFMKLTLSDATLFKVGADVTTMNSANTIVQTGGYTYKKDVPTDTIYVSDITRNPASPLFAINDKIYHDENANGAASAITINVVTHDILLIAERGNKTSFNTSISSGNSVYSITPTLPTGLTLNTKTGVISGTPTTLTPRKDFVLTATNFVGQSTYVFSLEVRDYFSLSEASGAPSFLLHKVGDTQINRKCRINATDIIANNGALLDVRCHLEAEEEDLYFNPVKLQANSGPGVCEYVQYAPYYFWYYNPKQSVDTSAAYPVVATVRSGCNTTTNAPTAAMCDGNYSGLGGTGPNCDEGKLKYFAQATAVPGGGGPCADSGAPTTEYITCGGSKVNCMAGPVKDLLSDAALSTGFRSVIYQSPNGVTQNWTLSSPISKGDLSNIRIANSTTVNNCSTTNADVNTWVARAVATPSVTAPYGGAAPYYTFNCLNAASQIKARIRLIIRDWDRSFKIDNGIDLDDPSTTPSGVATDANGPFMNNSTADIYGYPFNNHDDWDNDYTNLGSCSNPAYVSEYYCNANGAVWTSGGASYGGTCGVKGAGREYAYPRSNL
jgi:hypothetical protein